MSGTGLQWSGFRLRPTEWLLFAYFLYVAQSSAFSDPRPDSSMRRVLLTLAAASALFLLAQVDFSTRSRFTSILRDWLPAPGMLAAYLAVDWLPAGAPTHTLEHAWIGWDRVLLNDWGGRAAIESLGPIFPFLLELSYWLLYAIPPVSIGILYFYRRRDRVDRFLFALLLPTLTAYVLLPRFPSVGPRILFPGEDLPAYGTLFRTLNLWLLDSFDIRSSVFPSGHVTVAWSAAMAMFLALPDRKRVGWILAALATLILLATVYGRYHYAVDGLAGIAISAILCGASVPLYRLIAGRGPGKGLA